MKQVKNKKAWTWVKVLGAGMSAMMGTDALAQEEESDWSVIVGGGAFFQPIAPGLSETEVDQIPYLDIRYKDRFFVNQYGIGGYLFKAPDIGRDEGTALGLSVGLGDGRKESDYKSFLSGMGDIDEGFEANLSLTGEVGKIEYEWVVSQGLDSDGHDGLHSNLAFGFGAPVSPRLFMEAGPFVHYADSTYMESFYGVSAMQAEMSQFDEYKPSSGIDRAGLEAMVRYGLTERWVLLGLAEYNFMLGDAKDSPLTEDYSYVTIGLAVGYAF